MQRRLLNPCARKCGRVVCNSCSPHRIIIPHQYIVRPPGSEIPMPQSLLMDSLGVSFIDMHRISGGERVRLCNPCVPDPNIAPPQSPSASVSSSSRSVHHRSRSSLGNPYGPPIPSSRHGAVFASSQAHDPFRPYGHRSRSIAVVSSQTIKLGIIRTNMRHRMLQCMAVRAVQALVVIGAARLLSTRLCRAVVLPGHPFILTDIARWEGRPLPRDKGDFRLRHR